MHMRIISLRHIFAHLCKHYTNIEYKCTLVQKHAMIKRYKSYIVDQHVP